MYDVFQYVQNNTFQNMLDNFTYYKWHAVVIKFSRELISFSMNNHFPTINELVGGLYSIVPTHVVYPEGPHFTPSLQFTPTCQRTCEVGLHITHNSKHPTVNTLRADLNLQYLCRRHFLLHYIKWHVFVFWFPPNLSIGMKSAFHSCNSLVLNKRQNITRSNICW